MNEGKTLIYIACKEGMLDILNYFLDIKLDPMIRSKLSATESEDCLEVACRWNNLDIVKCLLNRVIYSRAQLVKCIKISSGEVKLYLKKKYKEKASLSCCF
jgi:ankyrin repeat protein